MRTIWLTIFLAGLALAGSPASSVAQIQAPTFQRELYLVVGQGIYEDDPDCEEVVVFLSSLRVGFADARFGVSFSYENEDWPWLPEPPELESGVFFRHGDAFQAVGELYPLGFLDFGDTSLGRSFRPFVGAGVHFSRDGEPGRDGPNGALVYAVRGGIDPIVTAGARVVFRPDVLPLALQVQYRHTALFASDPEFEGPAGDIVRSDGGETISWGELSVGFSIPIGG